MNRKRRNTSSPEPDDSPGSKPQNHSEVEDSWDDSEEDDSKELPRLDEYSGQVGAFPGLADDGDELFYGPASDGVDYLRMVRSERKGIPYILTAPEQTGDEKNKAEEPSWPVQQGGYYHDGAYTAIPSQSTPEGEPLSFAQKHYYDSLLAQFRLVQATMRCVPPLHEIQNLAPSQFISFPEGSRKARLQWESHIVSHDPHPVQIACMDLGSVFELVRLLKRRLHVFLQHKEQAVIKRVGAWVWAVLGRCPDRGELSSEDIGEIRGLAQKAAKVHQILAGKLDGTTSDEEMETDIGTEPDLIEQRDAGQDRGVVGGEDGFIGAPEEALRNPELPTNAGTQGPEQDRLIEVTLDMLLTVAGEVYGQRDLLDLRVRWEDGKGG
ncbi:hypothetical protein A1O3_09561 [Capronia epimyces CBS 606.96]|uniref:Uncharacterized protein n=1 Tax=Capronia epimyces CBS 606.96 TaxID=1182542 RepID=W9XJ31_9EURO|nr:uncharacterized protein A1O3_09561 [Capronia epimyces CBS 606.96]EXJ77335.1 hypothetical protein A1O3_09561 [Capronia epimyces CBS 606.96]